MVTDFGANLKMTMIGRGLPPVHNKIWAETHGRILGTVIGVDQCSNAILPVGFLFWGECSQHANQGGIAPVALAIGLQVIWASS